MLSNQEAARLAANVQQELPPHWTARASQPLETVSTRSWLVAVETDNCEAGCFLLADTEEVMAFSTLLRDIRQHAQTEEIKP